jgi:hypothetical protein
MDKYCEFYCLAAFEEVSKKQRYFYIPANYKDMELVLKTDRYFKRIIRKADKRLKVNKKFIGNNRRH